MHFGNILLSLGLVFTLGLLATAVIDPLIGNCSVHSARVISSDKESSTIALPNGTVSSVAVGNLKEQSLIQVGAKRRLFSRVKVYKVKAVDLPQAHKNVMQFSKI
ncbi:hypothetical protein TUM4438_16160 [Shewanella sairae]|uniref:Uncharacterized protein n=1 Tax=Shewanella sairae TaxID=190310 RepID=A0ABQ4PAN1_9GAMM|nr:hypothetical protein [Shewanella sairae]MCL1130803.1 hypothetical protein [Shewanella sairae]GIU44599.1 hypothetical protein TUM4438_16160 [Shewanella sairae]